jgi:hypothetical protein
MRLSFSFWKNVAQKVNIFAIFPNSVTDKNSDLFWLVLPFFRMLFSPKLKVNWIKWVITLAYIHFNVWFKSGASNLRPKLDSEFKENSVFWPFFLRFLTESGPNYGKKADLRPRYQLGLDAPDLNHPHNFV